MWKLLVSVCVYVCMCVCEGSMYTCSTAKIGHSILGSLQGHGMASPQVLTFV